MVNVSNLPDRFCIGCYLPKEHWLGEEYPDGYTAFILDIKSQVDEAIQEAIELLYDNLSGFDSVAVVPSHQANNSTAGITQIASGLASRSNKVTDATACLYRHQSITKLTQGGY